MRLTLVLAFTALTATASAGNLFNSNNSEDCQKYEDSKLNDEDLNKCLPLKKLIPLVNNDAFPSNALQVLNEFCAATPCEQTRIDDLANNWMDKCAPNTSEGARLFVLSTLYTPIHTNICKENRFDLSSLAGGRLVKLIGETAQILTHVPNKAFCSPDMQQVLGGLLKQVKTSPASALVGSDWEPPVVAFISTKCGKDFADAIFMAAKIPEVPEANVDESASTDKETSAVKKDNDATRAFSFSALPVAMFVAAFASQF